MATTKLRAKTPMKNKMKFWRKMAEKRYEGTAEIRTGRQLRNAMRGMNHQGILTATHLWMFKSAGIDTPVYDAQMAAMHTNAPSATDPMPASLIEDSVILNEGNTSATI